MGVITDQIKYSHEENLLAYLFIDFTDSNNLIGWILKSIFLGIESEEKLFLIFFLLLLTPYCTFI